MIWVRHRPPAPRMGARGWPTNRTRAAGKDIDPFLPLLSWRMEGAKNKKNELEGGKKITSKAPLDNEDLDMEA